MNKKKIISILLSVILVISFTTTVLIATANAKQISIAITTDKQELAPGESATVSVRVTANCTLATMSIPVFYDKTLVTVSDETATLTNYSVSSAVTDETSIDTSKIYSNTKLSSEKFGFVLVNYIGSAGSTLEENTDSVVLTFKITAKENVSGTAVVKCVKESAKTENNIAGMLYFGSMTSGTKIDAIPENIEKITFTDASAQIDIGNSDNTLMVKDEFEYADYVVIDTNNNFGEYTGIVYGIDTLDQNPDYVPLATLADALTTNNGDDYLVITENENGIESTGALIEVVDENGDVLETYVFVYFGDVDGDGYLTANDGALASYYEFAWEGLNTFAEYVACDIDGDGMPSANDEAIISYYEFAWEGVDYQYVLAETAAANTYEWF